MTATSFQDWPSSDRSTRYSVSLPELSIHVTRISSCESVSQFVLRGGPGGGTVGGTTMVAVTVAVLSAVGVSVIVEVGVGGAATTGITPGLPLNATTAFDTQHGLGLFDGESNHQLESALRPSALIT